MKNMVSRKKMNMEKIARLAGVSRTTVSVVLRQHQGLPAAAGNIRVSDETRDRVLKTIVDTGYQPNPIGQALVSGKSFVVGLIVTNISDSFIHSFIEATEDEAERNNYGVMLATTRCSPARELQAIRFMLSKRVDGIIMSSSSIQEMDPQLQETIRSQNVSIVYLSYQPAHVMEKAGTVYVDADKIAELGITHLSKLGHKSVACVISSPLVRKFIMSSARKDNVSIQFWPRDTQEETLKRWKQSHDRPTAIFFEEDKAAIEFENIAVQAGVRIPEDVSVLGIDNIPEAATAVVPLTTVEQPQYEQGLAATRVLFDMIRGKEPQHVVLQPKLVVRKSTGVPHHK